MPAFHTEHVNRERRAMLALEREHYSAIPLGFID